MDHKNQIKELKKQLSKATDKKEKIRLGIRIDNLKGLQSIILINTLSNTGFNYLS